MTATERSNRGKRRRAAAASSMNEAWISDAKPLLGKLSDREVAKKVNKTPKTIARLRRSLGIASPIRRKPSASTTSMRNLLDGDQNAVKKALGGLEKRDQQIIRRRFMGKEPASLRALGSELGISYERVRQLEARAIKKMLGSLGK